MRHLIDMPTCRSSPSLTDVLESLDLTPTSPDDLRHRCEVAIAAIPDAADTVRKGKEKAAGKIVGEVMRLSRGRADARRAREIILEILR